MTAPVTLGTDSQFEALATRAGALADDAAPTTSNVGAGEVITAVGLAQIAMYWTATGTALDSACVDLQLWALDGSTGLYVMVDEVHHVWPNRVVSLRCRGSSNFAVRFAGVRNATGLTVGLIRGFGVVRPDEQFMTPHDDPFQLVDAGNLVTNFTSGTMGMRGFEACSLHLKSALAARGGTIAIEARVHPDATTWVPIYFYNSSGVVVNSLTVTAGAAFEEIVDLMIMSHTEFRVVFTDVATGAGTLDVFASRR